MVWLLALRIGPTIWERRPAMCKKYTHQLKLPPTTLNAWCRSQMTNAPQGGMSKFSSSTFAVKGTSTFLLAMKLS